MAERSGPKGQWKMTAGLRDKILLVVLREGIWKLEAIKQRLAEAWQEVVTLPSIQQVVEENGLGEPPARGEESGVIQGELLGREPERQLCLSLNGAGDERGAGPAGGGGPGGLSVSSVSEQGPEMAGDGGARGRDPGPRPNYSPAPRVYFGSVGQGDYNAYAGGLLFVALLARPDFLATLSKVLPIET